MALDFPKYLVLVNGKKQYMSFDQAAKILKACFAEVDLMNQVLLHDYSVRAILPEEQTELQKFIPQTA